MLENKSKIEEAVEWYTSNFSVYKDLASKVESIVKDILKKKNVNYHSVTSRLKEIPEYKEKASKKKYKDPKNEIMDMAGVRIITYLDSEARKVEEIIKSSFTIIPEHSVDKSEELGTDRVGYRSIHCVCTLGTDMCNSPENKKFSGLCFEIQIRTILQHAWAEFEHDRNYKFKGEGVLPDKLKRRLAIVAGSLELIDWTFEQIASSINDYTIGIHKKTAEGDLSLKITSASLNVYLREKFDELIKHGLQPIVLSDSKVIGELSIMGIATLKQLDDAIPKDFVEKSLEYNCIETYTGALRDIMMIYNAKTYFEKAWQESWYDLSPESINLLKYYGVPIDGYISKYNLDVVVFSPAYEYPEYELDYEPPEYEPDYEPPEEEPPEYEIDYEEPPDVEPPDEEPPDIEPPDEEPPDMEPPDEEPPDVEPPDEEPPDY